jgi:hypothetical protein
MCALCYICLASVDANVLEALSAGAVAFIVWEFVHKMNSKRERPARERQRQRRDAWGYD